MSTINSMMSVGLADCFLFIFVDLAVLVLVELLHEFGFPSFMGLLDRSLLVFVDLAILVLVELGHECGLAVRRLLVVVLLTLTTVGLGRQRESQSDSDRQCKRSHSTPYP